MICMLKIFINIFNITNQSLFSTLCSSFFAVAFLGRFLNLIFWLGHDKISEEERCNEENEEINLHLS